MYTDYPRHTGEPAEHTMADAVYAAYARALDMGLVSHVTDPQTTAVPIVTGRRGQSASGEPYVYANPAGWRVRIRYTDGTERRKFFSGGKTLPNKARAVAWRDAVLRGEA